MKKLDTIAHNKTTRTVKRAISRARHALSNQRGDFYISDAVKIIIAVAINKHTFEAVYALYVEWHATSPESCSLRQLCGAPGSACHR